MTASTVPGVGHAVPVRTWPETRGALLPAPGLPGERVWRRTTVALGPSASAEPGDGREALLASGSRPPVGETVGLVDVLADPGWHREGDGDTWRHAEPTVRASLRVFRTADPDGDHLPGLLQFEASGPLGRPTAEYLPDDLGDGVRSDSVLVTRAVGSEDGLALRVDLVRHTVDLDVVVSSTLPDPSIADDAVAALVRLLVAVSVDATDPRARGVLA